MSRLSFLLAGVFILGAGALYAGTTAADDEGDNTYDVDFYNHAGDSGTVILDGNTVCTLAMKQYCSQTLAKNSGHHTAVFHATAGYQVSESFDAGTCEEGEAINFDIYDDHAEITCNGLAF
ncbi:MAG TPA: hypothetical protein VGT42_06080 [Gammaproteobacteria bacterium]|nr:hypothetical protein [Gammaproteobacteria bacterium]